MHVRFAAAFLPEDRSGQPFVRPAGTLLRDALRAKIDDLQAAREAAGRP